MIITGKDFKSVRKLLKMKQSDMATALNIGQSYVSTLENDYLKRDIPDQVKDVLLPYIKKSNPEVYDIVLEGSAEINKSITHDQDLSIEPGNVAIFDAAATLTLR